MVVLGRDMVVLGWDMVEMGGGMGKVLVGNAWGLGVVEHSRRTQVHLLKFAVSVHHFSILLKGKK